jgi:uncharacterized protein
MLTLAAADVSTVYRIQQAGRECPEQLRSIMASEEETAVHTAPSLSTLFERGAQTGDSALVVQAYLDAGGLATELVELKYSNGDVLRVPLLHSIVVRNEHPHRKLAESVRLLVAAGASINATCSTDYGGDCTALMYALERKCCTRVLAVMLQLGADPRMRCLPTGTTALHIAAQRGLAEHCKLLLEHADTLLEARCGSGRTALMHAAQCGHLNTVQLLLQHSVDVNTVDSRGRTPLHMASMSDHVDVAACLLTAGADANAAKASVHSVAMVQLLLDNGADINFKNSERADSILLAACMGHVAMMELLVQRGLSVHAVDMYGNTPLMQAAMNGHTAAAEWLLQHGAAVNAVTLIGNTSLLSACAAPTGDIAAVCELLLANGADLHKRNQADSTALDAAAYRGKLQCARALIAAGADVNNLNSSGTCTLHVAVLDNHAATA